MKYRATDQELRSKLRMLASWGSGHDLPNSEADDSRVPVSEGAPDRIDRRGSVLALTSFAAVVAVLAGIGISGVVSDSSDVDTGEQAADVGKCEPPSEGPSGLVWVDLESGALVRTSTAGTAEQVEIAGGVVATLSSTTLAGWDAATGELVWCNDIEALIAPALSGPASSVELRGVDDAFYIVVDAPATSPTTATPSTGDRSAEILPEWILQRFESATGLPSDDGGTLPNSDVSIGVDYSVVEDLSRQDIQLDISTNDGNWSKVVPGAFAARVGMNAVVLDKTRGSGRAEDVDGGRSQLVAYSIATGEVVWTTELSLPTSRRFDVVAENIVVTLDSTVLLIDANGQARWKIDHGNPSGVSDDNPLPGQYADFAATGGTGSGLLVGLLVASHQDTSPH